MLNIMSAKTWVLFTTFKTNPVKDLLLCVLLHEGQAAL